MKRVPNNGGKALIVRTSSSRLQRTRPPTCVRRRSVVCADGRMFAVEILGLERDAVADVGRPQRGHTDLDANRSFRVDRVIRCRDVKGRAAPVGPKTFGFGMAALACSFLVCSKRRWSEMRTGLRASAGQRPSS